MPYKIIGGVRFYERKEIKDALAYLKLIINPHDDVSLRRVINVPARGIGKGVMDSLQAIDPDAIAADAPPLLAAGLRGGFDRRDRSWAKLVYAVDEGKLGNRATTALRTFRDLIVGLAQVARSESVYTIDRQDAGSHRLPERPARREFRGSERADREPDGAGVRGTRVRDARAGSVTRRFRRPAVAALGSRRRVRDARSQGLADDAPRRQGTRVSGGHHRRAGRGPVSALAVGERRRGARGRAPPLLCRHDSRGEPADSHRRGTSARFRRIPIVAALTFSRRNPRRARRSHRDDLGIGRYQDGFSHAHYEFRTNPYGRKGRGSRFRKNPELRLRGGRSVARRPCGLACASATRSSGSGRSSPWRNTTTT